jgi:hypothetical protein
VHDKHRRQRVADERTADVADAVVPPARRDPDGHDAAVRDHVQELARLGENRRRVDVDDALDGEGGVGEQAARVAPPGLDGPQLPATLASLLERSPRHRS